MVGGEQPGLWWWWGPPSGPPPQSLCWLLPCPSQGWVLGAVWVPSPERCRPQKGAGHPGGTVGEEMAPPRGLALQGVVGGGEGGASTAALGVLGSGGPDPQPAAGCPVDPQPAAGCPAAGAAGSARAQCSSPMPPLPRPGAAECPSPPRTLSPERSGILPHTAEQSRSPWDHSAMDADAGPHTDSLTASPREGWPLDEGPGEAASRMGAGG